MLYLLGSMASGMSGVQMLAFALGYILAMVIGFSMHEYAHAFSAVKLGDPTPKALGRLTLNPLKHLDLFGLIGFLVVGFGWARPVEINPLNFKKYRRDTFIVSISGVLTNLILAFVFSGLYFFFFINVANVSGGNLVYSNALLYFVHYFLQFSVMLNLALFVFNLLPIFPLDGFNAIKSFCKYDNKFINFMYRYGTIILLVIVITPAFDFLYQTVTTFFTDIFFKFWGLFV